MTNFAFFFGQCFLFFKNEKIKLLLFRCGRTVFFFFNGGALNEPVKFCERKFQI